jgi:ABC-type Fe3+ transport system permease subunit
MYDLPRASTTRDMFIALVVFFASIMLLALLTLHERRQREQRAQLNMEVAGSSPYRRRSTLANWLVGLILFSLTVALIVSFFFTSNPLVVEVLRSFAASNLVFLLINQANKAWRDELEPALNAPYHGHRGNYD